MYSGQTFVVMKYCLQGAKVPSWEILVSLRKELERRLWRNLEGILLDFERMISSKSWLLM